MELFLDPRLKDRGMSCALAFNCCSGKVSVGSTNEGWQTSHYQVVWISFPHLDVTVKGGPEAYEEWKALTTEVEKSRFMWRCLLQSLDRESFETLIQQAQARGREDGRQALAAEMRTLLRIY